MAALSSSYGPRAAPGLSGAPAPTSLRSMIEVAVRAPSAWNTQPWKFRIGEHTLEVFADRARSLGPADPNDRELYIACGAAIFNLRTALSRAGYSWLADFLPAPTNPSLLARLAVRRGGSSTRENDLLFGAIARRTTVHGRFRPTPIDPALLNSLATVAAEENGWLEYITGDWERRQAAELIDLGEQRLWKDPAIRAVLSAWVRPESGPTDGVDPKALGFGWLTRRSAPSLLPKVDYGPRFGRQSRALALQAPALAVLGTRDDSPRAWLGAGQALQRLLLRGAAEGVQAGFFSAAIHSPDLRHRIAELIGTTGHPQLILRLGHAEAAAPTPRRPWQESVV